MDNFDLKKYLSNNPLIEQEKTFWDDVQREWEWFKRSFDSKIGTPTKEKLERIGDGYNEYKQAKEQLPDSLQSDNNPAVDLVQSGITDEEFGYGLGVLGELGWPIAVISGLVTLIGWSLMGLKRGGWRVNFDERGNPVYRRKRNVWIKLRPWQEGGEEDDWLSESKEEISNKITQINNQQEKIEDEMAKGFAQLSPEDMAKAGLGVGAVLDADPQGKEELMNALNKHVFSKLNSSSAQAIKQAVETQAKNISSLEGGIDDDRPWLGEKVDEIALTTGVLASVPAWFYKLSALGLVGTIANNISNFVKNLIAIRDGKDRPGAYLKDPTLALQDYSKAKDNKKKLKRVLNNIQKALERLKNIIMAAQKTVMLPTAKLEDEAEAVEKKTGEEVGVMSIMDLASDQYKKGDQLHQIALSIYNDLNTIDADAEVVKEEIRKFFQPINEDEDKDKSNLEKVRSSILKNIGELLPQIDKLLKMYKDTEKDR